MAQKKDYYEILGVKRNATAEEIEKAYRRQITQCHPDHFENASPEEQKAAAERTSLLNQAHDILGDDNKRAAYDRYYGSPEQYYNHSHSSSENHGYQAGGYSSYNSYGGYNDTDTGWGSSWDENDWEQQPRKGDAYNKERFEERRAASEERMRKDPDAAGWSFLAMMAGKYSEAPAILGSAKILPDLYEGNLRIDLWSYKLPITKRDGLYDYLADLFAAFDVLRVKTGSIEDYGNKMIPMSQGDIVLHVDAKTDPRFMQLMDNYIDHIMPGCDRLPEHTKHMTKTRYLMTGLKMPESFAHDTAFTEHLQSLIKNHAKWEVKQTGNTKYPSIFIGEGYHMDPFQDADPPVQQKSYEYLFNAILEHFGARAMASSSQSPFSYGALATRHTATTHDYIEIKDPAAIQAALTAGLIPDDIAAQLDFGHVKAITSRSAGGLLRK